MIAELFKSRKPRETISQRVERALISRSQILLVEDDPMLREFIEEVVKGRFDAQIVPAGGVQEARQLLSTRHFAAAILDYRLTNGDGVELYREIVRKWSETEVVFLTAAADPDVRQQVEEIGDARVYPKDRVQRLSFLDLLFTHLGARKLATADAAPRFRILRA